MLTLIITIIILFFVVIVLTIALMEAKKYGTKSTEELVGLYNYISNRGAKRQESLDKILALFSIDKELTNTEIRNELKVYSRTAVRYMDELEKEGKVMQVGKIGYLVTYKLK
jgi:predicted HTH transcriptional regulator